MNLLVFFEPHIESRLRHLQQHENFITYNYRLLNKNASNPLLDIVRKISERTILRKKYFEMLDFINLHCVDHVYFSTAEGYLANNIITWLRHDRPFLKTTAIQHGVFGFGFSRLEREIRGVVNLASHATLGFFLWGAGFGSRLTNQYIVYNDKVKEYLVSKHGWRPEDVVPDLRFLKPASPKHSELNDVGRRTDSAVFFSQAFHAAGLCSRRTEESLLTSALNFVKRRHAKVYVKKHPRQTHVSLPAGNFIEVQDLETALVSCSHAYSFFSTALLDAELAGLHATALYHPAMERFRHFDKTVYQNFEVVLNIYA